MRGPVPLPSVLVVPRPNALGPLSSPKLGRFGYRASPAGSAVIAHIEERSLPLVDDPDLSAATGALASRR